MCERCEEKIPIDIFIPHIQQCVGRPRFLKTPESGAAQSNNKDISSKTGKTESAAAGKDSVKDDGGSSILGSLEQLVKGNFTGAASTSAANKILPPISSPVTSLPPLQSSPLGKFNINNLFPAARSVSPPSSPNSSNSKPASPNNNTNNNLLQPSLEKMLDSPIETVTSSPAPAVNNGSESKITNERDSVCSSPKSDADDKPDNTDENTNGSVDTPAKKESAPAAGGLNALTALQNFCNDQTKSSKQDKVKEVVTATSSSAGSPMSDPGAILAFSWAVNQAANTSGGDSAIKCPFCDTPFISKGAYRHHLSKMHFTKENLGNISTGSINTNNIPASVGSAMSALAAAGKTDRLSSNNRTPSPEAKDAEESLQSKYQKYSQLAKQLSCYDGTN